METSIETLKATLDNENAKLAKLVRRDMRRTSGPSQEMKDQRKIAMIAYRAWEAELTRIGR